MLLHGRTISNFESTIAAFSRTDDKALDGGIQFKRSTAEKNQINHISLENTWQR